MKSDETVIIRKNAMSVYNILFSPTGGVKKAADIFTEAFCAESACIDLTQQTGDYASFSFAPQDICIVSVPSYGGRVPAIAVTRLARMKGNAARAILIAVYGNRDYDDTLVELQDTLTACGFSCIAAISAIAEHSIMRQFAAGRPDSEDEKELSVFARRIRSKMEDKTSSAPLTLPGKHPYQQYGGVPLKPQAGKSCIRCGLCAAECPVGAIDPSDPSCTDSQRCISCMRCIALCPQKARSVNRALLTAAGLKLKKACNGYKKNELFLP